MDISKIKTNPEAESKGAWVPFGGGTMFRIARIDNSEYVKMVSKALKTQKRAAKTGSLDDGFVLDVMNKAIAEHILLDWKNLTDDEKPLAYSKKECLRLMTDPFYKNLRDLVFETAQDESVFYQENVENDIKNSKRS